MRAARWSLSAAAKEISAEKTRRQAARKRRASRDAGAGTEDALKSCVNYVARYGGLCRDCADERGVCPRSGIPCGGSEKVIDYVLRAYEYGVRHGFIEGLPRRRR